MSLFYTAADPKYPTFLSKNDVVSVNINVLFYTSLYIVAKRLQGNSKRG